MKKRALLIIDVQNDYFPGGKMEQYKAVDAAEKNREVLKRFREEGMPVIHIQHESVHDGAAFFLPGSEGMEIHELVKPADGETVLIKHYPNSFLGTGLDELLKAMGIEELVITGMMTLMCVDATTRAAKDLGYSTVLLHDATAARELEFGGVKVEAEKVKAAFLAALSMVSDEVVSTGIYLK